MKKILLGVLILIAVLALTGVYVFNMSGNSVENKDAEHSLSATALYTEYSGNEKKSDAKYIGKTIEMTGTVSEISQDQEGATVLMFTEPGEIEGVMCTIEKGQKVKSLTVGQSIKVKAQCTGMLEMTGVVLNKGILL